MKIIVCVKQVPGITEVETDPKTGTLKRAGLASVINPFDLYAIEAAVQAKERYGARVVALSMGPPQASYALKDALALGCDEAYLLSDRSFAGADTVATAYTLAMGVEKIGGYDVVVCGVKTVDGDTAQVGPMMAEQLGIPCICYAKGMDISGDKLTVERNMDDGYEVLETKLPCLLTAVKEMNNPRMPDLVQKLESKKKEVTVLTKDDLDVEECNIGLPGSPTQVVKVFTPEKRGAGEIIRGTPEEMADALAKRLRELKVLGD